MSDAFSKGKQAGFSGTNSSNYGRNRQEEIDYERGVRAGKNEREALDAILNAKMPDISNKSDATKFIVRSAVAFVVFVALAPRAYAGEAFLLFLCVVLLMGISLFDKHKKRQKDAENEQKRQEEIFKGYEQRINDILAGKKVPDLVGPEAKVKAKARQLSEKEVIIRQICVFIGIVIVLWISYKLFH